MSKKVMRKSPEVTEQIRTGALIFVSARMINWSILRSPSWKRSNGTVCSITSCCRLNLSSWKRKDAPAVNPVTVMPSRI